jgi:hypothetical protein
MTTTVRRAVTMRTHPYATFVVQLLLADDGSIRRTRVVHIQTHTEETWPGWDETRLLYFIVGNTPQSGCRECLTELTE